MILENFLKAKQKEIDDGEWNIQGYIRAVPKEFWVFNVSIYVSKSLEDRFSAVAKTHGVKMEDEWPYNPHECPANMGTFPPST